MENTNKWQSAALDGLLLSLATVIASLIQSIFSPGTALAMLLWLVKFGTCQYLLYYFMKQYATQFNTITYGESFRYGAMVSVFSSIVCASFAFISMTFLFPGDMDKAIEAFNNIVATGNYSSEEEQMLVGISERLPQVILFWSLIYYSIYGVIVSAIIANFTKKTNPFSEEQNEQ